MYQTVIRERDLMGQPGKPGPAHNNFNTAAGRVNKSRIKNVVTIQDLNETAAIVDCSRAATNGDGARIGAGKLDQPRIGKVTGEIDRRAAACRRIDQDGATRLVFKCHG